MNSESVTHDHQPYLPGLPYDVPELSFGDPGAAAEKQVQGKEKLKDGKDKLSDFEVSTLHWTRTSLIVSSFTGLFICAQFIVMFFGYRDTRAIAVAARDQAKSTSDQLAEMKSSGEDTHQLALAAASQLGILETEQRAWISMAGPPVLQPTGNGVIWALRNFGNSPAFHIAAKGVNVARQADIAGAQEVTCREIGVERNWELLFPAQIGRPRAAFSVGAPIQYVVGCIRYSDQFSPTRWTRFCYEPNGRDPNAFIGCFSFNSTDADGRSGRQSQNADGKR